MLRLLALFVGIPILELALLIEIGRWIGTWPTVGLIVATGVLGAALARHQGLGVLADIRAETARGRLPAGALFDGAVILVAAAVLMTPGVVTDAFGFLCLVPAVRRRLKERLKKRLERGLARGDVRVVVDVERAPPARGGAGEARLQPPAAGDGQSGRAERR